MADAPYEPTPEEIEAAAGKIEAAWTPQERKQRLCGGVLVKTIPLDERITHGGPQ